MCLSCIVQFSISLPQPMVSGRHTNTHRSNRREQVEGILFLGMYSKAATLNEMLALASQSY